MRILTSSAIWASSPFRYCENSRPARVARLSSTVPPVTRHLPRHVYRRRGRTTGSRYIVVRSMVSPAARRRSTSATTRRARSSGSPGGRVVIVPFGVPAHRGVAAADVAAGQADPQVHRTGALPYAVQAVSGPRRLDLGRGLLQVAAAAGRAGRGQRPGCSSVSWSARRVAMVSIDSSMSKAASTCSTTSWSIVPLARILQHLVPFHLQRLQPEPAVDLGRCLGVRAIPVPPTWPPAGPESDRASSSTVSGGSVGRTRRLRAPSPALVDGLQHGRRLQRVRPRVRSAQPQLSGPATAG